MICLGLKMQSFLMEPLLGICEGTLWSWGDERNKPVKPVPEIQTEL